MFNFGKNHDIEIHEKKGIPILDRSLQPAQPNSFLLIFKGFRETASLN